ncbi:hypothetical protein [Cystobacter fuscus]|uniref:hypothetical protein n=1 Tax=Cystobacter fuscus TaxID=43 RepID=UPI0005B85778|nr:hypothetical protein [Cystobacter fuscus]
MARASYLARAGNSLLLGAQLIVAGCTAGREVSRPENPSPALMRVKCLITTRGTSARCHVLQTVPEIEARVVTALSMRRSEAFMHRGRPAWIDYTFNIQVQPSDFNALPKNLYASWEKKTSGETEEQKTDAELRQLASFLCRHQLLDFPATSRLPAGADPSLLIRREDLLFLWRQPFLAPFTELDRRDLHEDVAHFVSCEVTEVRASGDTAVVSLRRSSPPWEALPLDLLDSEDVLAPRVLTDRLQALQRWAEMHPARGEPSVHSLAFVKSSEGWFADYHLPEKAHPAAP